MEPGGAHGIQAQVGLEMHTMVLCADVQFLGITRNVLNQLRITPKIVGTRMPLEIREEFDVIVVGARSTTWRILCAVRRSKLNRVDHVGCDRAGSAGPSAGVHSRAVADSQACLSRADRTMFARRLLGRATAETTSRSRSTSWHPSARGRGHSFRRGFSI